MNQARIMGGAANVSRTALGRGCTETDKTGINMGRKADLGVVHVGLDVIEHLLRLLPVTLGDLQKGDPQRIRLIDVLFLALLPPTHRHIATQP